MAPSKVSILVTHRGFSGSPEASPAPMTLPAFRSFHSHPMQDRPRHASRDDLRSVLIIGQGLFDRQACEFDTRTQLACLEKQGYRVILVNSNPATIMTDPDTADATYVELSTGRSSKKSLRKSVPMHSTRSWSTTRQNCALILRATRGLIVTTSIDRAKRSDRQGV